MNGKGQNNKEPKQTKDYSSALSTIKKSVDNLRDEIAGKQFFEKTKTKKVEWLGLETLMLYTLLTGALTVGTYYLFQQASTQNKTITTQFAINNEPYLQITGVKYLSFNNGLPDRVVFTLSNLGNYMAKLIEFKGAFQIGGLKDKQLWAVGFLLS